MKKIALVLLILAALSSCIFALFSCKEEEIEPSKTVMNISINPKLEFILDEDDKVISVNAVNDEGNIIVSADSFVGKDAAMAARLFISLSKEYNFIVEKNVNVSNADIIISFSGDEKRADKLFNNLKSNINEYLAYENITAEIKKADPITRENLEELLFECEPYLKEEQIKAFDYNGLIENIYLSRVETKYFYSQEIKNAYYESKAFALEQAEFAVVREKLSAAEQAAFDIANGEYIKAISNIENLRKSLFIDKESGYQTFLEVLRSKKINYYNYKKVIAGWGVAKVDDTKLEILEGFWESIKTIEKEVVAAENLANEALGEAIAEAKILRDRVISASAAKSYSAISAEHIDEIKASLIVAKKAYLTKFKSDYLDEIVDIEFYWNNVREEITAD